MAESQEMSKPLPGNPSHNLSEIELLKRERDLLGVYLTATPSFDR